jgi:hypothetical protein
MGSCVSRLEKALGEMNMHNQPAVRPQAALLYDMHLPLRRAFYPLGFPIEILTNEEQVLTAAQESFGHTRLQRRVKAIQIRIGVTDTVSPEPLAEPLRREFGHLYSIVADPQNQAILDLRRCTCFVWLNRSAVKNSLYLRQNFLEKVVYLLLGAAFVTDIHAACVGRHGKGILLCGDSGAGKSTLSYACARAGWAYTSDDTSYLINRSRVPRVIGHAHRVRFRPAAKTLFPELQHREITPRMEGKESIEVPIEELPVARTIPETKVAAIVYLKRHGSALARLDRLPDRTATERMCADLFSAGDIRIKHERILQRLGAVPTYELHYCDLAEAMELLERLTSNL